MCWPVHSLMASLIGSVDSGIPPALACPERNRTAATAPAPRSSDTRLDKLSIPASLASVFLWFGTRHGSAPLASPRPGLLLWRSDHSRKRAVCMVGVLG